MADDERPGLSVLVPTYNYAKFIGDAVASVLDQRVSGVEVVIADDGSTDDTREVLRPWIDAGAVRYHRQSNSGPSAARNLAMSTARGSLFMFLDADDTLMPGCIEATIDFFDRYPEVGLLFTNYDIFDDVGIVVASGVDTWKVFRDIPHREVEPTKWVFSQSLTPYIIRYGAFMHTSGLTLRREVAEEIGPFREGYFYGEDDEFYARAAHVCTAGYLDRVLSRKRNHQESLIHADDNRLRNTKNLLDLTEIQMADYQEAPNLQRILRHKSRVCAEACAWGLVESRCYTEARGLLRRYVSRHPFHWPFHRLMLKVFFLEVKERLGR